MRVIREIELVSWGPSLYGWEDLVRQGGCVDSVPDGHRDVGGDRDRGRGGDPVGGARETGVASVTAKPVRDALAAFERGEAKRREGRMAHMRRVDNWAWLAGLSMIVVQVQTHRIWPYYAFVGLLGLAMLLPTSVTWPGLWAWLRRRNG